MEFSSLHVVAPPSCSRVRLKKFSGNDFSRATFEIQGRFCSMGIRGSNWSVVGPPCWGPANRHERGRVSVFRPHIKRAPKLSRAVCPFRDATALIR